MRVVIDTNIVVDVLAQRSPFFEASDAILSLAAERKIYAAVTANSLTDIHYILRKNLSKEKLRQVLRSVTGLLDIIDVTREDCHAALASPMADFEDALLACCAENWSAEYIITRNIKDFDASPVPAQSPVDFISSFYRPY